MVNERDTGDRVTNTTNQITRKQPVHMGGRDGRPVFFSAFDEGILADNPHVGINSSKDMKARFYMCKVKK